MLKANALVDSVTIQKLTIAFHYKQEESKQLTFAVTEGKKVELALGGTIEEKDIQIQAVKKENRKLKVGIIGAGVLVVLALFL